MVRAGGGVVADQGEPVEDPGGEQRAACVPGQGRVREHPERRVVPEHRAQVAVGEHELVGAAVPALGVGQGEGAPRGVRGVVAGVAQQAQHEPGEPVDLQPGLGVVDRALHRLAQLRFPEQGAGVGAPRPEGLEQRVHRGRVDEAQPRQLVPVEQTREVGGEVVAGQERPARSRDQPPVGQRHRERRELLARGAERGRRGERVVEVVPPRRRAAQPGERARRGPRDRAA